MENSSTDGYNILTKGCATSPIQDFECYLRIVVGLDGDELQLISKHYNSNFVTYELSPGIYTIKDISEAVYTMGDHEGTLQIKNDDITMKTKPILTGFDGIFGKLRFNKKSFLNTLLGFTPYWDSKLINAINVDSSSVYNIEKLLKFGTNDKIHLKSDAINGSVVNGLRQPILFSFILKKRSGYKVIHQRKTVHYRKLSESALNTTRFYIGDDNNKEVDFNGETLTFTLQIIEIYSRTSMSLKGDHKS